jgi:hypothetical protein
VLRDARPFPSLPGRLLFACLLLVAGSVLLAFSAADPATSAGSPLSAPCGIGTGDRGAIDDTSPLLTETSTEALSMPAESEGDEAGTAAFSPPVALRAPDTAATYAEVTPSRHIRHPGRGPPAA